MNEGCATARGSDTIRGDCLTFNYTRETIDLAISLRLLMSVSIIRALFIGEKR